MQMGKLKVFLMAFVVFTQLADVFSTSVNEFVNQVIYVETYRYRGRWLDAHHTKAARFGRCPESEVVDHRWTKWIVRQGPERDILALESVRYSNHFLDAHNTKTCRVTYSSYPYNQDWALWYLEYSSASRKYAFRSKRYNDRRLDAHNTKWARVTKGSGEWSQMRVYQPDVSERRTLIFTYDNSKGTTPVDTSFTETIGISRTDQSGSSYEISGEMGMEIKSIFSAKRSLSAIWEQSTSATWSKVTSRTVEVTVDPGTVKEIYQLMGSYGLFDVASNHLYFEG